MLLFAINLIGRNIMQGSASSNQLTKLVKHLVCFLRIGIILAEWRIFVCREIRGLIVTQPVILLYSDCVKLLCGPNVLRFAAEVVITDLEALITDENLKEGWEQKTNCVL